MSRRTGRELEQLPHYVYLHYGADDEVIYVGRTADPDARVLDRKGRPWIATESRRVTISPAMPFETACWVESQLIAATHPKHNTQQGQTTFVQDWRIDRICEAEGVDRRTAQWAATYFPTEPAAFEAFLAKRLANPITDEAGLLAAAESIFSERNTSTTHTPGTIEPRRTNRRRRVA